MINTPSTFKLSSRLTDLVYLILFTVVVASVIYLITLRSFHVDEFESIHSGWKILNGEVIYQDFIQQKNPILFYLLAIVVSIFGESVNTILASSYFIFIFSVGIIFYTYRLSALLFDKETAKLSVLLLPVIPWFALSAYEIRPDVPMLFFCMASIYYLYLYFENANRKLLIASALCLGIAYLFIQKAIFWFVIVFAIFIHRYFRHEIIGRDMMLYGITLIAVYITFLLIISTNVPLSTYLFYTFEFVKIRQSYLGGPFNMDMLLYLISRPYSLSYIVVLSFLVSAIFSKLTKLQWEIAFCGLWLLFTVLLVTRPGDRYFLPSIPFVTIIISYMLVKLSKLYSKAYTGLIIIIVLALSFNISNLINVNDLPNKHDNRQRQFARVQYVLDQTSHDDYVYDGIVRFNVFRKDLDFVWLSGDELVHQATILATVKPYHYNIYELIYNNKPKIISHYYIDTIKYPWILRRYKRNTQFEDIYTRIKNNTGFDIWYTYVDSIGSLIKPETNILNKNGDIEVTMTKISDPVPAAGEVTSYPYVGIGMAFGQIYFRGMVMKLAADLKNVENIVLTYKLSGEVSLLLAQDGISPGEEYQSVLLPADDYTEIVLNWDDFHQHEYVTSKSKLRLDRITGIKFQVTSTESNTAVLGIRNVKLTGLDPDQIAK